MFVGLHNCDKTKFPNLALMKLAAWHRAQGDTVQKFIALMSYDKVYSSKVFSWSATSPYLPSHAIKRGSGYGIFDPLPDCIEHICPDYDFYGVNFSLGFLTRGCVRSCEWCIVPKKEGAIRVHADIEEFCRHKSVVLMDNNVLACDHGITQIEKMAKVGLRVDFNQGLDARLIDQSIAKRLAALKWRAPIRLACDDASQMPYIEKAVRLLREAGAKPKRYSCYVLVKEIEDALERVMFLRSLEVDPFAQPYRKPGSSANPPLDLRRFARWVNHRAIFKSVPWEEYEYNTARA